MATLIIEKILIILFSLFLAISIIMIFLKPLQDFINILNELNQSLILSGISYLVK